MKLLPKNEHVQIVNRYVRVHVMCWFKMLNIATSNLVRNTSENQWGGNMHTVYILHVCIFRWIDLTHQNIYWKCQRPFEIWKKMVFNAIFGIVDSIKSLKCMTKINLSCYFQFYNFFFSFQKGFNLWMMLISNRIMDLKIKTDGPKHKENDMKTSRFWFLGKHNYDATYI